MNEYLFAAMQLAQEAADTTNAGKGLRDLIATFVGNIFMAGVGAVSLVFLFRREFVRFMEFLVLALLIGSLIYVPEVWIGLAKAVGKAIGAN